MKLSEFNFLYCGLALLVVMMILNIRVGAAKGQSDCAQNVTATFESPALMLVDIPEDLALSESTAIELKVLPRMVDRAKPYLVQVYIATDSELSEGDLSAEKLLGIYAFFPPAKEGEIRRFVVAAPANLAERVAFGEETISLVIKIIPVIPKKELNNSSLTILEANIVE